MPLPVTVPAGPICVSACLLGKPCRYNGKPYTNQALVDLARERALVPVCPESLGGLPTPRNAAEVIVSKSGVKRVVDCEGNDLTSNYATGAAKALSIALDANCGCAFLAEKSPSCGCGKIFDGTFSDTLVDGNGITAQLFLDADIPVFGVSEVL